MRLSETDKRFRDARTEDVAEHKPCPFCGGANLYTEHGDTDSTSVRCNDCYTHGPAMIAAWTDMDEDEVERRTFALWDQRK